MKTKMILLTGFLALAFLSGAASNPDGYKVGDYATDFELKNVNGELVSLSDYESARGFIVVFTCNTCPYAKLYEQRIIELDKKYRDKGFPVIAINPNDISQKPDDSMEAMQARAKDKNYPFPYLRDDAQEITAAYGATKTPHFYVLNKEGADKYRVEYIGALDDSPREASDVSERYVEDAINAILKGKKPEVTNKKAIGCTIKWKEA